MITKMFVGANALRGLHPQQKKEDGWGQYRRNEIKKRVQKKYRRKKRMDGMYKKYRINEIKKKDGWDV